jgi:hypothetical protein
MPEDDVPTADVVTPGDGQEGSEVATVPVTVPSNLDQQNIARIASAGASAHEHFISFGKILDLAYEADRKMVSLVESLGVREVASRSGQLGIPQAAQGGGQLP